MIEAPGVYVGNYSNLTYPASFAFLPNSNSNGNTKSSVFSSSFLDYQDVISRDSDEFKVKPRDLTTNAVNI